MEHFPTPPCNTRIGFHYFPDTLHYREYDLVTWLPELRSMGACWLTLEAPLNRAIPESFLRGLSSAGIEPVLHFRPQAGLPASPGWQARDLRLLLENYADWGLHYVVLFDRPNLRSSWSVPAWSQRDLVERFLDQYLPLAEATQEAGLYPVFPPLEPGGDYWDTAFLRLALQGVQRRGSPALIERLVLGAYAWVGGHPLDWGAGGPERWPAARPYETPPGSQDQRGFYIFDWYLAQARAVFQGSCPLLILGGGSRVSDFLRDDASGQSLSQHTRLNLAIADLMDPITSRQVYDPLDGDILEPPPGEVLACNYWLLASLPGRPYAHDTWFSPEADALPVVEALKHRLTFGKSQSVNHHLLVGEPVGDEIDGIAPSASVDLQLEAKKAPSMNSLKLINHYLLLPSYEWGVSDWHLDVIRPFVKKYHPVVGFSMEEAVYAHQVTVVGGAKSFPEEGLQRLRQSGCVVQQINGDGTDIATQLATM